MMTVSPFAIAVPPGTVIANTAVELRIEVANGVGCAIVSGRMLSVAPTTGRTRTASESPHAPVAFAEKIRVALVGSTGAGLTASIWKKSRPACNVWFVAAFKPTVRVMGSYQFTFTVGSGLPLKTGVMSLALETSNKCRSWITLSVLAAFLSTSDTSPRPRLADDSRAPPLKTRLT